MNFIGYSQVIPAVEPSAVDRLAAIADPAGKAAERVYIWDHRPPECEPPTITFMDSTPGQFPAGWTDSTTGITTTTTTATTRTPKRRRRRQRRRRRR